MLTIEDIARVIDRAAFDLTRDGRDPKTGCYGRSYGDKRRRIATAKATIIHAAFDEELKQVKSEIMELRNL